MNAALQLHRPGWAAAGGAEFKKFGFAHRCGMRFSSGMKPVVAPVFSAVLSVFLAAAPAAEVRVERVPNGGLQPQALTDVRGVVHLVYLSGTPRGCDVFYVRREPGKGEFTAPLRVNSQPGSAVAAGTIRGAQIAMGRGGRIHVVWNGSDRAEPKPSTQSAPLLYSRINDAGTAFEPQRNLINATQHLDGGGTVAADGNGNVYAFWHSAPQGDTTGEPGRMVFLARSRDEGVTFERERIVSPEPTGACGCCGMKAFSDSLGNLYALYRTAAGTFNRDMTLLVSRDRGEHFTSETLHRWRIGQCPMSSEFLTEVRGRVLAAWETDGPVQFASLNPADLKPPAPTSPAGMGKAKHPAMAVNQSGEILLVWSEASGRQRGGAVTWQVFNPDGGPAGKQQHQKGTPALSFAAAVAGADGSFTVFY